MATYEELQFSSFTDLIVPFTSDNGLGETSTGTKPLTGYTLEATKFTFTPILSAIDSTNIGASIDKLIWDMGDGTFETGYSVSKQYEYPGEYKVTTIITDQNGVTHKNRRSQTIRVFNYVPDALVWYTPTIASGLPEKCLCGVPSDDLTIYRYNSWQSWPVVSADGGYYINLYSQASHSRPLSPEQYRESADAHLNPTWRFVESKDSTVPIERTQTTNNTHVYIKKVNNNIVHTTATDPDGYFAGTSGSAVVNYIDDNSNKLTSASQENKSGASQSTFKNENLGEKYTIPNSKPNNENKDIILFCGFDTSKFPVTRYDRELDSYELLKKDYFQIYETQKVGLPITVKFNCPTQLNISSNGIPSFNIHSTKYLNSPFSLSIRTQGASGDIVVTDDIVPLSSHWTAPSVAFSGGDITTDVLTAQGFVQTYLSGSDSTFTRVIEPISSDEDFKIWDTGAIYPQSKDSFIRLLLTERSRDESPEPTGRVVTILTSQLEPATREVLLTTPMNNYIYGVGSPRLWTTIDGREYYAYISPASRYDSSVSLDTNIIDYDLPMRTPGSYNAFMNIDGDWNTISNDNKYRLFASTLIDPPLYFDSEVMYYYLTNPSNDIFHQIKPVYYREFSYGDDGNTQTYTQPITTQSPGNSGMYGFATEPTGECIIVDGDTDKILRYSRRLNARAEIDIYSLLPDVSANFFPADNDAYGYSPSSVSLDKNLDYWVTLYDTVSTIKISGQTNNVIACAVPPEANYLADSRTTSPSALWTESPDYSLNVVNGRPGEYGEQIINPTTVETCKNNDIIVTYTNPLCSFIVRYDPAGNFKYKYEFPGEDRYFTGDVCVDVSDHVWAVTESTGLNYDGSVNMDPPKSVIYSFDEELTFRLAVSSLSGTEYQDMQAPLPYADETIEYEVLMDEIWDPAGSNDYIPNGLIIEDFGETVTNPKITLYEGNTYIFKNLYYNRGQHPHRFRHILTSEQNIPLSSDPSIFTGTGDIYTDTLSGDNTDTLTLYVSSNTPNLLMIDDNYSTNRLVVEMVKKPVINTRPTDTFDIINNATHVIPDNNNNIWFSWGRRFCSRYNVIDGVVDTTIAVGSAYEDTRYHALSADLYDRRDDANRRSAIEGISCDTANNLLVINNADKRLYSMNSDTPPVSAFIEIANSQIPYENFSWMTSVSSDTKATSGDFLLPTSYLTDEQINVFVTNNTSLTGTDAEKRLEAQSLYNSYLSGGMGDVKFRLSHGNPGVSAVGLEQEIRAGGDWTGWRWINKYDNRVVSSDETTGFVAITGASDEFQLIPKSGIYDISKVNEDIDFAGVLRGYIQQPSLKDKRIFYDEFLNTVFGTNGSSPVSLGKRIYERIANYMDNHSDIDVCTIDALHNLASMVNYKLSDVTTNLPTEMSRLVDILSINFSKLRGTPVSYQNDFEKYGNWSQETVGVNLGSELLFIFDYDPKAGYMTGDYVYYLGEYYESRESVNPGITPINHPESNTYWKHWPDGYVRPRHMDDYNRIFQGKSSEWRQEQYDNQSIIIKLIQNLQLTAGEKVVFREEHTNKYTLVTPMMINWKDNRVFDLRTEDTHITVTDPNQRWLNEYVVDQSYQHGIFDIGDDGLITLMGSSSTNPTLTLFRNRTYRFNIDSPGDPIEITTTPGPSATRLDGYVSNQGAEYGQIVLKTDDDPIFGPIPSTLYYQSVNNPSKSGAIVVKYIDEVEHYSTEFDGVTSYNINISLSSHQQIDPLGWGLSFPEDGNAWQYYSMYEYIPQGNKEVEYKSSVIDWKASNNTLDHSLSSYNEWSEPNGLMEIMLERQLRQGLELFDGMDSINTWNNSLSNNG